MEEELVDSMEGWVPIKFNPFADDSLPPRMTFLVSWNDVERKIAITCRLHSRTVSDNKEDESRTGIFSFQEIRGAHEMLCLIQPSLRPYIPNFPEDPWSIWTMFAPPDVPENIDEICEDVVDYLTMALEVCKEKLLMSTFFEEHCPDDYFESISDLRKRDFLEGICNAEEEMQNVIFLREGAINMSDLNDVYTVEDDVLMKMTISLSVYYNYQLQPFLDMREVAFCKLREAKIQLQNPNIGDRVKRMYATMFSEWQEHYDVAVDNIHKLYMKYYSLTCEHFKGKPCFQDLYLVYIQDL